MAPDLDVFIRSSSDPLLMVEYHRHFTHAMAFVPLGALMVSLILWPVMRSWLKLREIYGFAFLGYLTHGPLDAFTSYGTHLIWPFSPSRSAWNMVSVVDPLVTVPLLGCLLVALIKRRKTWVVVALAYLACYLAAGLWQRERALAAVRQLAAERGHQPLRMEASPTIGNLLLWRGYYEWSGYFFIDGVRPRLFADPVIYPGGKVEKFSAQKHYPELVTDSVATKDIARFTFFADGWVGLHPHNHGHLGDMRYSALPNETLPLWGIAVDSERQEEHVSFHNYRNISKDRVRRLRSMIFARPLE